MLNYATRLVIVSGFFLLLISNFSYVSAQEALPDLIVENAVLTATNLSFTVRNQGTASSGEYHNKIQWTNADGVSVTGTSYTEYGQSFNLDPGASLPVSVTFAPPNYLATPPANARYLRITVDSGLAVTEPDENNNAREVARPSSAGGGSSGGSSGSGGSGSGGSSGGSSGGGAGGSSGSSGGSSGGAPVPESGSGSSLATWSQLVSGVSNDLNSVECPAESICYIVGGAPFIGGSGVILKTINGGDSWVSQSIPITNPLRGISCLSTELCYAAGDGGALLKTVNGGGAWTRLAANTVAGEQYYWDIDAVDASNVTAVGNAGIIYRTTNGGATWTRMTSGTVENLHNVHFAGAIGWIAGTGGKVLKTINGGLTWFSLSTPSGLNVLYNIDSNGNKLWVSGDVGRVIKSDNAGLGWILLRPDTFSSFRAIDFLNETDGFIAGSIIRHTTDGGVTWTEEYLNASVILRGMACPSAAVCYVVGDDGMILRRGSAGAASDASAPEEESGASGGGLNFSRIAGAFRNLFRRSAEPEPVTEPAPPRRSAPPQGPDPDGGESTPRPGISPEAGRRIAGAVRSLFENNLNAEQRQRAEGASKRNRATTKIRGLNLNPGVLNQNRVLLNLFPEKELSVEIKQRQEKSGGIKIFKGNVEGVPESKANFVSVGNVTVGNIHTPEGIYEIRYAGGGAHTVRLVDPSLFREIHPKVSPPAPSGTVTATYTPPPPSEVADAVVDVMVLLTIEAHDALGDDADATQAFVELMIAEANLAYDLSNVGMRLNLAYWAVIGGQIYHDARNVSSDLATMSDTTPAPSNRLHGFVEHLRDEYEPDIVTLLVSDAGNEGRACGIGYIMNEENEYRFGDIAYSVVDVDCVSNYSYIHELGHNMGLGHDRINTEDDDAPPRYSYAFGYQDPQERFRTIMAYNCDDADCQRIPFFSNPNMTYVGIPFGTATEDNARALRNSRFVVANYSESRGDGGAGDSASDAADALRQSAGQKAGVAPSGPRVFRNLNRVIQTFFMFDEKKKAELGLKFANEDLLDAKKLADIGDSRAAEAQLESFGKNLDKVENIAKQLDEKDKTSALEFKKNFIDNQLKQQAVLRAIQKETGSDAKEKIRDFREKEANRTARSLEKVDPLEFQKIFEKTTSSALPALDRVLEKVPEKTKQVIQEVQKKLMEEKAKEAKLPYTKCPRDVKDLMCGENGLTYLNPCFAEESNVKIAYKGECKDEQKSGDCKDEFKPVCGTDGRSYKNICEALDNKVKMLYEGKCGEEVKKEEPVETSTYNICSKEEKALVCGADGLTYFNKCFAGAAKVKVVYSGECGQKAVKSPDLCTDYYEPVCGVDGKTYLNSCEAEMRNEVKIASKGKCGESEMPKASESTTAAPTTPVPYTACDRNIKALVCGQNGLTYLNKCFAEESNVKIEYIGECKVVSQPKVAEPTSTVAPTPVAPTAVAPTPAPTTTTLSCSKDAAYVCGANGLTYLNECLAKQNNVTVAYKGQCQVTTTSSVAPTTEKIGTPSILIPVVTVLKPVISTFAASPTAIAIKQSSTLSWVVSGADSVILANTKESLPVSGKKVVTPVGTTTYTITATNKAGSVSASVVIYVK